MMSAGIPTEPRAPASLAATRTATWVAAAAALAAAAVGLAWGTHVAGGSDSYCYLSQAELLASGRVVQEQPLAPIAPWENGAEAFMPAGHVPASAPAGAAAPMCPPGYPMLMAMARLIAGRPAMFAVVPVLGAIAVWGTFLLGRRIAGPAAGALAALLLAASPPFLYQIVQPMSDVPAAAAWALAALAVTDARFASSARSAWLAGVASGAALIIRPNLVPVAAVTAFAVFVQRPLHVRRLARTWAMFGAGLLPFVAAILLLQKAMYGGALQSGYGALGDLFSVDHVRQNMRRYPLWLVQTETPIVLCAIAAPWLVLSPVAARQCVWLMAFAGTVLACYLPYVVFDAWWYLRFVLPAYPAILALTAAAIVGALRYLPGPAGVLGLSAAALVSIVLVRGAIDRHAFGLRDFELRFRLAGEYVESQLPANAAVVTAQESGSVRFYSGRLTLAWRELPEGRLERALNFLRTQGYRPYLLLERWEQADFVAKFGSSSPLGTLAWPAVADINHEVRIYDPDDYARYRAGVRIATDRLWIHYGQRRPISLILRDTRARPQ
jgi:hypothetical protein